MAKYKNISKSLDRCFKTGIKLDVDESDLRWIIFSDHHRGTRDGADDFLMCEDTYAAALNHYYDDDFSLCLLGDVEEFWENTFLNVMVKYSDILIQEKKFYDEERLHRIWGNHDDAWRFADTLRKHLGWLFPNISVYESIVLRIKKDQKLAGEILLVHGHQGSMESDRFSGISKWFVKNIWRNIQRLFKVPLSTASTSYKLKSQHDIAMYHWAKNSNKTIITGHTHHPVFMSLTHEEKMMQEIDQLQQNIKDNAEDEATKMKMDILMSKVQKFIAENPSQNSQAKKSPCYFNSGCCSFSDGDITGIELADKKIRLIKWDKKTKERVVLEEIRLKDVLSK